ncbi:MAG TPA: type II secretion system protein [Gemmatimonadaceae bacterium]|nr:type II secretion system protein [Gemmatimonadaceae bacterium]
MTTKRSGFTLTEIMVVIAIIGVIMAVSAPRIASVRDRTNLRAARDEIASALATARSAAVQKGVTSNFFATRDSVQVKLGTGQQIMPVRPLRDMYGAAVTVVDPTDTLISYDTRGLATRTSTSAATFRVTVGSLSDSVCVSRLGLVTKLGCLK